MKLDINVEDRREHINFWLTLFQSGAKYTDREKSVLCEIINRRLELEDDSIKEPYLTKLLFDSDSRKIYCESLSISAFNLTNILSSLVEKEIIGKEDNGYSIPEYLIPSNTLTFEFKYED